MRPFSDKSKTIPAPIPFLQIRSRRHGRHNDIDFINKTNYFYRPNVLNPTKTVYVFNLD